MIDRPRNVSVGAAIACAMSGFLRANLPKPKTMEFTPKDMVELQRAFSYRDGIINARGNLVVEDCELKCEEKHQDEQDN